MGFPLKTCLTSACLLLKFCLSAQDKTEDYLKQQIPESLTKNADAVCRLDEHEVDVKSPGKITVRERRVYSILNSNAEELSSYIKRYDKLTSINYVDGWLYNSAGKEIQHFKKKDMSDYAGNGDAFVSDERVKFKGFNCNTFPFSVAFESEDDLAGAMYIPLWRPPVTDKMSLEVSRYILTVPSEYKFRYKMVNTDIKPVITEKKDKITYVWEIRNLPVRPEEPFSVSPELSNPFMLVGPTEFQLQGFSGNMSEWKEYGKFYASLQKGRDILPEDVKQTVHKLTDQVNDPVKKIAILYDYLQKNTHYVLIMFGIGGLQTYDADYVAKNKFGDCKALSNYMISLLKEAGLKGHAVLIKGDENEPVFFADFPAHQFNHVICCVPLQKDTIWLECTDQYLPAGYLSAFTANRYGLFIDDDGGTLVHTPLYTLKDNTSIRNVRAVMDDDGNVELKSETVYRALSYDEPGGLYHHLSKEKQLDYLKKKFDLPTYTVNALDYKEDFSGRLPVMKESLDMSVSGYAHITGKRIFVNPDILRRSEIKLQDEQDRKLGFEFKTEYSDIDSIEIAIPKGYEPEARPKDILLETVYGKFKCRDQILPDKIIYYRQFDHYRGRYPASSTNEISNFYNKIYDSDHTQIVLVKKG